MFVNCALAILLAATIQCALSIATTETTKFEHTRPAAVQELPDEKRLTNFKERNDGNEVKHSDKVDADQPDSRQEKKTRTILSTPGTTDGADNPQCCGGRYGSGSTRGQESLGQSGIRPSSEMGRYPSRYGTRPDDRYGWQSYTPPGSSGRRGSIGSSSNPDAFGGNSGADRYGSRPSYYSGDNDYDRPGVNGNRPTRPGYGYGYGDSGSYGSSGFEVSRPGYGRPPSGGTNFGSGRPGGTYGNSHGVYGVSGAQEGEFPGDEEGGEGSHPPPVNNLQTQKAVALKALAGVALIGAAAALATNPVLLPIGVLAGRKRRSLESSKEMEDVDIYKMMESLEIHIPKIYKESIRKEVIESPTCVARLACEIEREYRTQKDSNEDEQENWVVLYETLKKHLVNLIQSKFLKAGIRYKNVKELMKSAKVYNGECNIFVCDFTKD